MITRIGSLATYLQDHLAEASVFLARPEKSKPPVALAGSDPAGFCRPDMSKPPVETGFVKGSAVLSSVFLDSEEGEPNPPKAGLGASFAADVLPPKMLPAAADVSLAPKANPEVAAVGSLLPAEVDAGPNANVDFGTGAVVADPLPNAKAGAAGAELPLVPSAAGFFRKSKAPAAEDAPAAGLAAAPKPPKAAKILGPPSC